MRSDGRWSLNPADYAVLRERAVALAFAPSTPDLDATPTHVTVNVGQEIFALDVRRVREVLRGVSIQPVPAARGEVVGIVVIRGAMVVVLGLRALLGLAPAKDDRDLVVIGSPDRAVAVAVGGIGGLVTVSDPDIHPAPALSEVGLRYVVGEVKIDGRSVLVLDLDSLLVSERLPERGSPPTWNSMHGSTS
jgi:purine-binding chemotaxis protein CheW